MQKNLLMEIDGQVHDMKVVKHGRLYLLYHDWEDEVKFSPIGSIFDSSDEGADWDGVFSLFIIGYKETEHGA